MHGICCGAYRLGLHDVLCIQEHKLWAGKLSRILNEVWPHSHWVCAQAAEGIHAHCNPKVEVRKGGMALGINSDLAQFISSEGITGCNQAVWIM